MAGTSNYPGALDDFAEASPTNLGDEDSTGRTHSERHDDLEAAMEAVQGELGTDPSGASASTVAARFTTLDSTVAGKVAASVVTTAGDLIVGAGSASVTRLGKGTEGYVLTSSSAGAQGLIWAEASGGATVEMSPTEPVNPDNGTLWVDTDSSVPTFTASAYVLNSLVSGKGSLIAATADDTPADLAVGSNGQMLMADSSATTGLRYVDPPTNRSLIVNGAMQVSQRGTSSTSITAGGFYTADRWALTLTTLGTWTQSVEVDGPAGTGLVKSLKMLCTTADNAPTAAGVLNLQARIEGADLQRVAKGTASAQQLTCSFWVKSNVTGTYIVELVDADNTRSVSASYTVSSSATWEKKVISFPSDSTGAFDNDANLSLRVAFWLASGSNFTSGTLATTWGSTTSANRAVGQTNLAAATNNYWQITGVQLETGPVATPFEFEPYEATLRKCQRYYMRLTGDGSYGFAQPFSSTQATVSVPIPSSLRAAPSSIDYSGVDLTKHGTGSNALTAAANPKHSGNSVQFVATVASGLTGGDLNFVDGTDTNAYLGFNAEL